MIKRATLVWLLLAACAGTGLFIVKYEVQGLEDQLAAINHDVLDDLDAIHVLKAEWAYLNQPARLEDLGDRLLDMEPMTAAQVTTIDQIPLRDAPDAPKPQAVPKNPRIAGRAAPWLATYKRAP
jgi:hypothetical protein